MSFVNESILNKLILFCIKKNKQTCSVLLMLEVMCNYVSMSEIHLVNRINMYGVWKKPLFVTVSMYLTLSVIESVDSDLRLILL